MTSGHWEDEGRIKSCSVSGFWVILSRFVWSYTESTHNVERTENSLHNVIKCVGELSLKAFMHMNNGQPTACFQLEKNRSFSVSLQKRD